MRVDGGKTWMRFMFLLSIADLGDCQGSVAKFGWLLWSLVVTEKGGTPEIDLCFLCFVLFCCLILEGRGDGTKKHHWPSQCAPGLFIPAVLLCVYSQRPGVSASPQSRIKLPAWHHSNEWEELFGNQIFILRTENLLLNIFLVSFLLSLNFETCTQAQVKFVMKKMDCVIESWQKMPRLGFLNMHNTVNGEKTWRIITDLERVWLHLLEESF